MQTLDTVLDEVLDHAVFSNPDPRIQKLKEEWRVTEVAERGVLNRLCEEEFKSRRAYHNACRTPFPDRTAEEEVRLNREEYRKELEERLNIIWSRILMRVTNVLAAIEDEREA